MLKINLTKGGRRLLLIMPLVALAIVASGYFYFHSVNRAEDPRVLSARKKFARYDRVLRDQHFSRALAILDEIESVYRRTPGYQGSFELGVIENNRAGIYLVQAETERLSNAQPAKALLEDYLQTAHRHAMRAIDIYTTWQAAYASLDRRRVEQQVRPFFQPHDAAFTGLDPEKIIDKRVDDLVTAREEMPRRLSVAHTNLGLIARYQNRADAARHHYETAISLWPMNRVARNNLNVLLGRPIEQPSVLRQLFPPSRKE